MCAARYVEKPIDVDRIFLDLSNPRHERYTTQNEAIEYLCRNEGVLQLARDVKKHGLNPLERFAVVRQDGGAKDTKDTVYVVAEGNRRLCALMLLNDPDLAPPNRALIVEKLSEGWDPIEKVTCVIFDDQEELNLWLERIHQGPQGGVGRKPWSAVQKQRHSGTTKNRVALALLEFAVKNKMISSEDQKGKLTTIQRYVSNPLVRSSLGVDQSNPDEIYKTWNADDFKLLAGKFFKDLLSGHINSRSNKPEIEKYASELVALDGQSRKRVEATPILEPDGELKPKNTKPPRNIKPNRLPCDAILVDRLRTLGNYKLQHLYSSLCNVPLQENTPLLAVGLWSFVESLTARAGRTSGTSFHDYLSQQRLQDYAIGDRHKIKSVREVLLRIQEFGNVTKHDDTAAAFNGEQLLNDLEMLGPVLTRCVEDAAKPKS